MLTKKSLSNIIYFLPTWSSVSLPRQQLQVGRKYLGFYISSLQFESKVTMVTPLQQTGNIIMSPLNSLVCRTNKTAEDVISK